MFLFQKWIPDISIKINVIKIFNKIKIFLNKNIDEECLKNWIPDFFFSIERAAQGSTLNREMCF